MSKRFLVYLALSFLIPQTFVLAQEYDESETGLGYDEIIEQLSAPQTVTTRPVRRGPFADTRIHAGVSLVSSFLTVSEPGKNATTGFVRGVEARFGIDLLSRYWIAEGSVRSFSQSDFESLSASLKEFDLKIIHRPTINRFLQLRMGGGISARYLSVQTDPSNPQTRTEYSTPAGIALLGLQTRIHNNLHVGLDVGYRWSLIDETADSSAIDAGFGINAIF